MVFLKASTNNEKELKQVWLLRRMFSMIAGDQVSFAEGMDRVLERMRRTKTNAEFLANLTKESA